MGLELDSEAIREGIVAGRFSNEAAVSQGIVLRLLHSLGWPAYDTQVVWPEYALSGRRVDYALCHPPSKPIAIIEVKQIGQSDGAERQLFEYAFHDGVPLAILTDGRDWNFFLPGEQGDYVERRVYKLDIVDRDLSECTSRLSRYLGYDHVTSGAAMQAARDDYRNVSKERQIQATLPKAWSQIIKDEDEMLLEIVADRVETLCGFKPSPDVVASFLQKHLLAEPAPKSQPIRATNAPAPHYEPRVAPPTATPTLSRPVGQPSMAQIGFTLAGKFHPARNAIEVLRQLFEELTTIDPSFPDRFAGLPKHGRKRRYLARDQSELYPGHPDLCREASTKLSSGWWLGTNCSRQSIRRIIEMARPIINDNRYRDFQFYLGE